VLNHYDTGLVVPVTQRKGAFFISSADLLRAGCPGACSHRRGESLLAFSGSGGVRQRRAAPAADRSPRLGHPRDAFQRANGAGQTALGRGALLNYDLYTNHTEHIGGQASLWHEFRYFNENGSFSSTGYARENFTGNDGQQEGYVRYDTTLLFTNEDDAMSWSAGDVISDALSWSSSVRMGDKRRAGFLPAP
jgi:outer membrane usher protein